MTAQEMEHINVTARADLTKLIKEYARAGYRAAHGQRDEDFEAIWNRAFDADRAKEESRE